MKRMGGIMRIVYAQEDLKIDDVSIFLAGPSPRDNNIKSWRPEAIQIFKDIEFEGILLVPEFENTPINDFYYEKQISWEVEAMNKADIIMFWIPRNLETLPGFTTNIEFGYWLGVDPYKIELGYPPEAENMRYIEERAKKEGIIIYNTLEELIKHIKKSLE